MESGPATPADVERRSLRRGLGCALGGVAGFGGLLVALVALLGVVLTSLTFEGCDIEWSDPDDRPGDGSQSKRLDVDVAPTTGLDDGTTVFVTSTAFEAGTDVGITQCLAEAALEREGVAACDTDIGTRIPVDEDGVLRAAYAVSRVITVDGEAHDCAVAATRCVLVAAASWDLDLSGGQPLSFADGLPPVDLVPSTGRPRSVLLPGTVAPAGPVAVGTAVTASAGGFVPGEDLVVALCTSDVLDHSPEAACQPIAPVDSGLGPLALLTGSPELDADDEGAAVVSVSAPATITPVGGFGPDAGGERVDCTEAPGRCGIVIASRADTQRSAYLALTVTP